MDATTCAADFNAFLRSLRAGSRIGVVCHSDADGLSAGAIVGRTLEAQHLDFFATATRKFENPWTPEVQQRLKSNGADALVVVDSGIRPQPVLAGVPTCFIDHHQFDAAPPGSTVISGFGSDPTPTSSLLAWWCAPAEQRGEWLWLAALGMIGDLGDRANFDEMTQASSSGSITAIKKVVSLVNGFRRSAGADHDDALRLLMRASSAKDALMGPHPETARLLQGKEESDAALDGAKRIGPKVRGDVALIVIDSGCQIHSLVAQRWRSRLARNVVICANIGYHPGWVHFSARSALGINLIDFLKTFTPRGAGENFAKGHIQATGGSLPVPVWNEFVSKLGFPAAALSARQELEAA